MQQGNDDKDERKERGINGKERGSKTRGTLCSVLSTGEVFESAALFDDCFSELLEDPVHVSALPRPQALEEANMAAVTRNKQGQVGILLHCLHWNGCKGDKAFQLLFNLCVDIFPFLEPID